MLRVLVVDDEPYIKQGLAMLINWMAEGFTIIGEAANGKEAIRFLQKTKVDLIIADIKMPEMNGIELLEYIKKEKLSDASYIILSGYYDFQYARSAIQHNCCDYLLKPVQKDELLEVLRRVSQKSKELNNRQIENREKERALFDRNLLALIWGKFDNYNIEYVTKHLMLSKEIKYITINLDFTNQENLTESDKRNIQKNLYMQARELLKVDEYHVIFDVGKQDSSYDIGFIYCDYLANEAGVTEGEYLKQFSQLLSEGINCKIMLFVGNKVDSIARLSESYQTAMIAKTLQMFRNDKDITFYEENMNLNGASLLERRKLDILIQAVEENNKEEISSMVDSIYDDINQSNMDYNLINLNISYILYQLIYLATKQDDNINQEEILQYISKNAFHRDAMRGSRKHFKLFAYDFSDYLQQLRKNVSKGILASIEREIEENYAENISLKSLSEKYFINSAYLGQVFKKQFGLPFKDYLNNHRIDRAAELLLRTDEKVYIVAELVGYHNLDYFINRFVSVKGCTPTRYRNQSR
ncbi:response regulator transcription factor [Lachnoclostridium phytofermentans]|nr:response regulator [Lachnoclostridium phytofermentans]